MCSREASSRMSDAKIRMLHEGGHDATCAATAAQERCNYAANSLVHLHKNRPTHLCH